MIKSYNNFLLLEFNDLRNKIDLQKEYDRLNKELFNGELYKIPLIWEHIKKHGGRVLYKQDKYNGRIINSDISLAMSDYYDYDYDMFINTMAHELIHVYLTQNNTKEHGGSHGYEFQQKMKEINSKGYNITVKLDITDVPVTKTNKLANPVCVILLENNKGDKSIAVYDYKLYNEEFKDKILKVIDRIAKTYSRHYKVWFIYTYNGEVKRYSIRRTFKMFQASQASENIWKQLMDSENNQILFQTEIN